MITKTMKLAAAAASVLMLGAPVAALAQNTSESYDGYCYAKKNNAKTTGTVVGAVAGGALGSQVSKNERGLGAIVGAVAGGALGRTIASSTVKCLNGEYYSYQTSSYTPEVPPEGYNVVYYKQRPSTNAYSVVYYDTARHTSPTYAYNGNGNSYGQPYNGNGNGGSYNNGTSYNNGQQASNSGTQGWKDNNGNWHTGRPVALGWKDSQGRWHEGQIVSYGYKDTRGSWHEETAPSYGYNNNGYRNGGNN